MAQRPPLRPRGPSPRPGPSYGGTATARATFCRRRLPPGSATSRLRASASPRAERRPASTCGLRAAPPRAAFRGSGRPQPEIGPALGPAFGSRARPPLAGRPRRRRSARIPSWRSGLLAVGSAEAEAGAAAPRTVSATAARFGLRSRGLPSLRGAGGWARPAGPGRGRAALPTLGAVGSARAGGGAGRAGGSAWGGSVPVRPSVCLSVCLCVVILGGGDRGVGFETPGEGVWGRCGAGGGERGAPCGAGAAVPAVPGSAGFVPHVAPRGAPRMGPLPARSPHFLFPPPAANPPFSPFLFLFFFFLIPPPPPPYYFLGES